MSAHRPPPRLVVSAPTALEKPLAERGDDDLMLLARAGRQEAFAVLVERYLPRLVSFCGKFISHARLGEELAQEVLLQTWAQRHHYQPQGHFIPFLFTLANNLCRNHVRDATRRRRRESDEPAPELAAPEPAQLDVLLERERTRRVHEAIGALPENLREAVLLRFDQGLDYADISRTLGCREVTARSRVFHGIKRLRASLHAEDET
ncbi:RNA polymerase sigma factor [Cystobacter fuscus]|uniref:RNA polymerase sigma factor n=1 Tax=Cystobacter fuscus TaxID=43 RepID=UPI002B282D4F|nr:RNA polymerase sigma factor [Cystobacter fuscus]